MVQWGMYMESRARISSRSARRLLFVSLLCAMLGAVLCGCEGGTHHEAMLITAEVVNVDGLFVKVQYLRDGKLANSVHLVDGDGDGVVDGKSGPKAGGSWPVGWSWFDDLYKDTIVGETTISFRDQKIVVSTTRMYEFMAGEYEVRSSK